jgi:asparagine synthase (glutamine-hydrolysing)
VREAVLGERLADSGYFDAGFLRQLVERHQSGQRDHSAPLWSLVMFDAFLRQQEAHAGAGTPMEAAA